MYSLSPGHVLDLFLMGSILLMGFILICCLVAATIIGCVEYLSHCEPMEEVPLNTRSRTLLCEFYALLTSHYSNERRRSH